MAEKCSDKRRLSMGAKEANIDKCPVCRNHCPREKLKCGRGRKYFRELEKDTRKEEKAQKNEEKMKHEKKNSRKKDDGSILYMLKKLGHKLRHSKGIKEEHLTSILTEAEQKEARKLLEKMDSGLKHKS